MKIQKKRPTTDGGAGGAPGFTDKTGEVPNIDDVVQSAEKVAQEKRKKEETVKKAVAQVVRTPRRASRSCGC